MAAKKQPQVGGLVPLPDAPFVNGAGTITNIRHNGCGGTVSIIECLPGTTRSRHAHKTDRHDLFVLSGEMLYWERPLGSKEDVPPLVVREGQMVRTLPGFEHKTHFTRRTVLVSISEKSRTHEEHEADLVRVDWP